MFTVNEVRDHTSERSGVPKEVKKAIAALVIKCDEDVNHMRTNIRV